MPKEAAENQTVALANNEFVKSVEKLETGTNACGLRS
jgi:hypothetical protein